MSKKSFAGKVVSYQFPFLEMGLFILVLFGMEMIMSGPSVGRKAISGRANAGVGVMNCIQK